MARKKRFIEDWNIYHVIIRCNNRQMLLRKKEIKYLLMSCFGKFQERLGFKLYGFVIMDNHEITVTLDLPRKNGHFETSGIMPQGGVQWNNKKDVKIIRENSS